MKRTNKTPRKAFCVNLIAFEIFVEGDALIVHLRAVEHDNAVADGVHKLLVVRSQKHHAFERGQPVVERGDRFEVEVVGRLVEDQKVSALEHHFGEHAAHFLAARKHLRLFERLFARKKHAPQPAAQIFLVVVFGKLRKPLHERERAALEIFVVVLREVTVIDCLAPLDRARIGLFLARKHVVKHGNGSRFIAHDADFIALLHGKIKVFKVAFFRQSLDAENIVADLALEFEVDKGIFAQRRLEVGNGKLFEFLFARSRLTRFACVRREPRDKFFELGGALLGFFVRFLLLTG